jgi:hypothetical protein
MVRPVARLPAPLVLRVRSRIVANVDPMALVLRRDPLLGRECELCRQGLATLEQLLGRLRILGCLGFSEAIHNYFSGLAMLRAGLALSCSSTAGHRARWRSCAPSSAAP